MTWISTYLLNVDFLCIIVCPIECELNVDGTGIPVSLIRKPLLRLSTKPDLISPDQLASQPTNPIAQCTTETSAAAAATWIDNINLLHFVCIFCTGNYYLQIQPTLYLGVIRTLCLI